jgi:hypothetical protein
MCYLKAQDDDEEKIWDKLLEEEVEVENPVYMPVLGIGPGILRYYGDLETFSPPLGGNKAMKINISTFLGKKHFFKTNFFIILLGSLSAQQYSTANPENNLNFTSQFTTFGINLQYSFEHYIPPDKPMHPFISLGFELTQFSSKTDLLGIGENNYIYFQDGTIRDKNGNLITKDYEYETDLRKELDYGLGDYAQNAIGIPLEIGVNLSLTERANVTIASGIHYMMSDLIDHISVDNTKGIIGKKGNDMFGFNYITFHYDLFSDDETVTVRKLFADIDFDYTMYGDEDNDWVFDRVDKCPGTPENVDVDSVGCPLDDDADGVPNYLDMEKNTPPNAWVNQNGVEVSIDELIELMNNEAVSREDVKAILRSTMSNKYYASISNVDIPKKFIRIDRDNDGYISFEEVLDTMDKYFEGEDEGLTPDDLKELKDFFFSQ